MIIWSDYPMLSLLLVSVLVLILMYILRRHAHAVMVRCGHLSRRHLRLFARGCLRVEQRIGQRNAEITRSLTETLIQRRIEREFMRIETLVEKDLASYQLMAAEINDQLAVINSDYEESGHVPPPSPEWLAAVDAMTQLKDSERNTEVMAKILTGMHQTIQEHQRMAMREHRWTVNARHKILSGLRPHWRKLAKRLAIVDSKIEALSARLRQVDLHMSRYESLVAGSDNGSMASMSMRFVVAGALVVVGVGAGIVNHQLLVAPMESLFFGQQIVGLALSDFAALLHGAMVLVAATMLFETLRVTQMLPLMAAMSRRGKQALLMISVALWGGLSLLSGVLVSGVLAAPTWLDIGATQWALLLLSITTPWVLGLVVIPLEYFIHTLRPVVGGIMQILLHGLAFSLRLLGAMSSEVSKLMIQLYDVAIFIPLRLEQEWRHRKQSVDIETGGEPEYRDVDAQQATLLPPSASLPEEADSEVDADSRNVTTLSFNIDRKAP